MAQPRYACLILGAGAAGMMCAAQAAAKGGRVLIIDHAKAAGEKIRISGGGRCNFTNMYTDAKAYLSQNPHFCKSALARYTQWDFLDLVGRYNIAWHEKTLGQLFCDDSAKDIIQMLLDEMAKVGVELRLETGAEDIRKVDDGFVTTLSDGTVIRSDTLVVATGGKSIPKMGSTGFGYRVAEQFGHDIVETRPALVPFTFGDRFKPMAGVSLPVRAACNGGSFDEAMLFTHRGLSGPAILQISSYWREGDAVAVNLLPDRDAFAALRNLRQSHGRKSIGNAMTELFPAKLATEIAGWTDLSGNMADQSDAKLRGLADAITGWSVTPTGSEGYRTAEVTLGGVNTDGIDARSMESRTVAGLYFIGEVVDVTGWLGGYNFQWAWASGVAAGRAIADR